MELLDIYDENRRKTGMTRERSDPLQPGWYDLVVVLMVVDRKNRVFCTRRSPEKARFPAGGESTAARQKPEKTASPPPCGNCGGNWADSGSRKAHPAVFLERPGVFPGCLPRPYGLFPGASGFFSRERPTARSGCPLRSGRKKPWTVMSPIFPQCLPALTNFISSSGTICKNNFPQGMKGTILCQ